MRPLRSQKNLQKKVEKFGKKKFGKNFGIGHTKKCPISFL